MIPENRCWKSTVVYFLQKNIMEFKSSLVNPFRNILKYGHNSPNDGTVSTINIWTLKNGICTEALNVSVKQRRIFNLLPPSGSPSFTDDELYDLGTFWGLWVLPHDKLCASLTLLPTLQTPCTLHWSVHGTEC